MANAIVSFGVQKLWELVSQEYNRLEGVGEQITELKSYLNMLMSFLSDAEGAKTQSALARNCVEEIKEITYDAEDIIETFLVKEEQRNGSVMKNHMRSLTCIQGSHRKTALEITSITKRISRVINVMQIFGIKSDIMNGGCSQALLNMRRKTRHTFSSEHESNLIGMEENVKTVVDKLVGSDCNHGVSITGLGGLGKTTLARRVFNHDDVKSHFNDRLAWVCVSQDFTLKDVWQTILRNLSHAGGDYVAGMNEAEQQKNHSAEDKQKKISEMNEDELQKELFQLLEKEKALIVFDDVWKTEDWNRIKPMFPERQAGWKVLLTSRNDKIYGECETFKPKLLKDEECWTLLHRIAFPMNDTTGYIIDKEMVKMAKEMVKHCGGLPLAVKVLGGLLAAQHTLRQWKMIYENIKSHILGGISFNYNDSSSVKNVLSLSFEGLPSYLKHCLLHLASYPEDHRINLEDVSYIWAAEGITKPWDYEKATIRDVSDVYVEELVKRNLVISESDMVTSRFEFCQLHDLMREVCLLKGEEENNFKIVTHPACSSSVHSQTSNQSRRLVVHTYDRYRDTGEVYPRFNGVREIKNSKLRSLLFIPFHKNASFTMGSNFMELQLLRVLDLNGADFKGNKLPCNIGKLIHLKYLSLYELRVYQLEFKFSWRGLLEWDPIYDEKDVNYLPSSIGNLKSLLYLNLDREAYGYCHVPNVLKEMQELRYLRLPKCPHKMTKLELGGLVKLETLINFSTKESSVTDLHRMTRLRSLSINIVACNVDTDMLASTLSKLRDLENLTISKDCYEGRMDIRRLFEVQNFPSHLTLTTIELIYFNFKEDPMPILEKLVHLKEVKLEERYFRANKMVCSRGGFPNLKKLVLFIHHEFKELVVEESSMPLLHTLDIRGLESLEIPDGLRFLYSLKDLTMSNEWKERLSVGGQYHEKVKHIPFVKFKRGMER